MRIASVQLNSQNHLDTNLSTLKNALMHIADTGADLVVLPENACYMGRQADIADKFHQLRDFFQEQAATHKLCLIAGTLPCPFHKDDTPLSGDKFYQTSLAIDQTGRVVARYDKIHLFRATVNDGIGSYDEGRTFLAGDRLGFADFQINNKTVRVGMMICFDLRFPKLAQNLRQLGAEVLVAPSAFTYQTGKAHWELLLKARAIDSQCAVIGAAQGGTHRTNTSERKTWGHSTITAADGTILSTTGQTDTDEKGYLIATADVDLSLQAAQRTALPIFDCHRLA